VYSSYYFLSAEEKRFDSGKQLINKLKKFRELKKYFLKIKLQRIILITVIMFP